MAEEPRPNRIRFLLDEQGWTLRELSDRTGISFTMLNKLERGDVNLTLEYMRKISRAFGLKASALLNDEDVEFRAEGDNLAIIDALAPIAGADRPLVITMAAQLAHLVRDAASEMNSAARSISGAPGVLHELAEVWNPLPDDAKRGVLDIVRAAGFRR